MGWEWFPETPEEKAEHQRMKRELLECQQIYDNVSFRSVQKPRKKKSLLGVLLVLIILSVMFIMLNDAMPLFSFNNKNVNEHYGRSVAQNTSDYIQQVKSINLLTTDLFSKLNDDFRDDLVVNYVVYSDSINDVLLAIERLQNMNISRFDSLKDYQEVCELYYNRMYSFFNSSKAKQNVSFNGYNQLSLELNSIKQPYDCLTELFDENGFYYHIESDGTVFYKINDTLF